MMSNFSVGIPKCLGPKIRVEFLRRALWSLLMSLLREHRERGLPVRNNPQPTKIIPRKTEWESGSEAKL